MRTHIVLTVSLNQIAWCDSASGPENVYIEKNLNSIPPSIEKNPNELLHDSMLNVSIKQITLSAHHFSGVINQHRDYVLNKRLYLFLNAKIIFFARESVFLCLPPAIEEGEDDAGEPE